MKLRIIKLLDWIDDRIIGHRFHWLCEYIAEHDWWDFNPEIGNGTNFRPAQTFEELEALLKDDNDDAK